MRRVWAVLVLYVLAVPAVAQDSHDRLNTAFADWLSAQGTTGALGTGARRADGAWDVRGKAHVHAPLSGELASVSKSITAACAHALVQDGRLGWGESVADHLGDAPDVTVGELVTHTSGLGPDSTQNAMHRWLDDAQDPSGHASAQVLAAVNARGAQSGVRGQFSYNNENYALLGLVIEAVSGRAFFDYCRDALDLGDGIRPSPRTGAMQPWGGLMADPSDYLAFFQVHYGPDSVIGADPFALPHAEMGGGAWYGMGMVFRAFRDSHNFWHFGALCFAGRLNVGAYAVLFEGNVGAVALYDGCHDWDAMQGLDAALAGAVYR